VSVPVGWSSTTLEPGDRLSVPEAEPKVTVTAVTPSAPAASDQLPLTGAPASVALAGVLETSSSGTSSVMATAKLPERVVLSLSVTVKGMPVMLTASSLSLDRWVTGWSRVAW
jgi:hypothetical protein